MYYLFRNSSDLYVGVREVRKTASLAQAKAWASRENTFSFAGAANESLPPTQQNWHRDFYSAYEYKGLNIRQLKREYEQEHKHYRHSRYSHSWEDFLLRVMEKDGKQIEPETR